MEAFRIRERKKRENVTYKRGRTEKGWRLLVSIKERKQEHFFSENNTSEYPFFFLTLRIYFFSRPSIASQTGSFYFLTNMCMCADSLQNPGLLRYMQLMRLAENPHTGNKILDDIVLQ